MLLPYLKSFNGFSLILEYNPRHFSKAYKRSTESGGPRLLLQSHSHQAQPVGLPLFLEWSQLFSTSRLSHVLFPLLGMFFLALHLLDFLLLPQIIS